MDPNLRKGWTEIITAEDIDKHLHDIGQAPVNAKLIPEMLSARSPKPRSTLLFVGAGTGQLFDYIPTSTFAGHKLVFTDINSKYLDKLNSRIKENQDFTYECKVDDIECTTLKGPVDGIVTVLVLEHIDWKKGIESMVGLGPSLLYFIIQRNHADGSAVNSRRVLAPTVQEFAKVAKPTLVSSSELEQFLAKFGYRSIQCYERETPDNKSMIGLVFEKASQLT